MPTLYILKYLSLYTQVRNHDTHAHFHYCTHRYITYYTHRYPFVCLQVFIHGYTPWYSYHGKHTSLHLIIRTGIRIHTFLSRPTFHTVGGKGTYLMQMSGNLTSISLLLDS